MNGLLISGPEPLSDFCFLPRRLAWQVEALAETALGEAMRRRKLDVGGSAFLGP
jgi:hypothetical protein